MAKLRPAFSIDPGEDAQKEAFEEKIADLDYEKAVSICKVTKDPQGHSVTISFRMPDISLRIVEDIKAKEKRFQCPSDVLRTIHLIGIKGILKHLKEKGEIGDSLDDALLALDELNKKFKMELAYQGMKDGMQDKISILRTVYRHDKDAFRRKVKDMEETFSAIRDPFWKEYLLTQFRARIRRDLFDYGYEDERDEEADF